MGIISSTVQDTTTVPLGAVSPKATLDRLRPGDKKVTVAAFNSSI